MTTIIFRGIVLPEYWRFTSPSTVVDHIKLDLSGVGLGSVSAIIASKFTDGVATITCDVEPFSEEILSHVFKTVIEVARIPLLMHGFRKGQGIELHLHTVVYPDPKRPEEKLAYRETKLANLVTCITAETDLDFIKELIKQSRSLAWVFHDLNQTMIEPDLDALNCARIFDAIRHLISPNEDPKKPDWKSMHTALNVDRKYLETISILATTQRHGNKEHLPAGTMVGIVDRGWTVVNRYIEYRKRGSVPLPTGDFPLMQG